MTGTGVTQMLRAGDQTQNYVSVCENRCNLTSDSTSTLAKCTLPPLSTSYSSTSKNISQSKILTGTVSSSSTTHANVFDGDLVSQNGDTASNCHVTVTFTTGYVAVLDMVKFFLPVDKAMSVYQDNLKF
jgi:hypothetical protein